MYSIMPDLTAAFIARQREKATANPALNAGATPKHRAVIRDRAALITYRAGRRHGKPDGFAVRMATYARPGAMQAYVAPTITRAHEILLPVMNTLAREAGLRFRVTGSVIEFPNGGETRLTGM